MLSQVYLQHWSAVVDSKRCSHSTLDAVGSHHVLPPALPPQLGLMLISCQQTNISQGSVATHFTCGGEFHVANSKHCCLH